MALDATIALVTQEEAKAFIKKTDDIDLNILDLMVNGFCQFVKNYIGYNLIRTTYTNELYDSQGWPDFWLPAKPITTLTSVYENDSLLVENTDFYAYLNTGRLRKINGVWMPGPKIIKATYIAGFQLDSVPQDIKTAVGAQVSALWQKYQHKTWAEASRSLSGQSVTFIEGDILPFVKVILNKYRRRST